MAVQNSTEKIKVGQQDVLVSLKSVARLRSGNEAADIVVAGAGVIEVVGPKIDSYEVGVSVTFLMQETQQGLEGRQVKVPTSRVCRIPPNMSCEDAAAMAYPFAAALIILQDEMGILFPPSPAKSVTDEIPAALILGGERALAQALTQLLHIASPTTNILVACKADDTSTPERMEEAVRPFCRRAIENGAKYGIDGAAPDLIEHLQAAIDGYGGPLKLILDVGGEVAGRPEIEDLLHADGKVVECSQMQTHVETLEKEDLRTVMTTLEGLLVEGKVRPPVCTDMYTTMP